MERTGLPSAVCIKVANAASVSLRRIADADVAFVGGTSWTFHKWSDFSFPWCRTVRPSLVTCTSSLVKVAMHPLLQSSDILMREVSSVVSGNMCAVSGVDRCGNHKSPADEEQMVSPLGSVTRMLLSCRTLLSCAASFSRSNMWEEPVSAHGR